jgi:hypothetical protein
MIGSNARGEQLSGGFTKARLDFDFHNERTEIVRYAKLFSRRKLGWPNRMNGWMDF